MSQPPKTSQLFGGFYPAIFALEKAGMGRSYALTSGYGVRYWHHRYYPADLGFGHKDIDFRALYEQVLIIHKDMEATYVIGPRKHRDNPGGDTYLIEEHNPYGGKDLKIEVLTRAPTLDRRQDKPLQGIVYRLPCPTDVSGHPKPAR